MLSYMYIRRPLIISSVTLANIPCDDLGIGRDPDIYSLDDLNLDSQYRFVKLH